MTDSTRAFDPDWISPPGDTIVDLLAERGWKQTELARRMDYSGKHISQLVNGLAVLTQEAASRLERVLGGTAAFWLAREAQYRAQIARQQETKAMQEWANWLDEVPAKELMRIGRIPRRRFNAKEKPDIVRDSLAFYGVASPSGWKEQYGAMQGRFRKSSRLQGDLGAISAWLRLGEIGAEHSKLPPYSAGRFNEALSEARTLTVQRPEVFLPRLASLLSEAGVVFMLVPAIPRSHVSGVARWIGPRPMIQLSLYGKTNDRFWFTFFHEAAHVLLHARDKIFLDDSDGLRVESHFEREADQWAADMLIPRRFIDELASLRSAAAVRGFAAKAHIHPAIVVGRLQHDGKLERSHLNALKISMAVQGTETEIPQNNAGA